jgi:hypothetical protein
LGRRGECGGFGIEAAVGTVGVGFYGHGSHLGGNEDSGEQSGGMVG